jgi:prophage regulatory protein
MGLICPVLTQYSPCDLRRYRSDIRSTTQHGETDMDENASTPNPRSHRAAAANAPHGDDARHPPADRADRIVRELECHQRSGLSRSTRWRLERAGLFPRRRRVSPGCSGWLESELAAWIAAR